MYDPIGISIEKIDDKKGFIKFDLINSNLFDKEIPRIKILEIYKKQTVFILERDDKFNLKFIQSNPNYVTRIAKINIRDLGNPPKLFILFSWSEKGKNRICVGDYKTPLRRAEAREFPSIKLRVDKEGIINRLGDEGVNVTAFRVQKGSQTILEEGAREAFDSQLYKIKILIENCSKADFLFESTLAQQVIVLLVTAFETYVRTRFIELEKERKSVNIEELYERFVPKRYREQFKEEVKETALKQRRAELEVFIDKRYVNFQDWASFKDAYNKGYNLKIGEIDVSNDILIDIQKLFKWRHRIIHSKDDQTVINWSELPSGEDPIITDKNLAERSLNIVYQFINTLHENTLKL